jgi:hypothetical protein
MLLRSCRVRDSETEALLSSCAGSCVGLEAKRAVCVRTAVRDQVGQ